MDSYSGEKGKNDCGELNEAVETCCTPEEILLTIAQKMIKAAKTKFIGNAKDFVKHCL